MTRLAAAGVVVGHSATHAENVTGYPVFDRDPLPPQALRPCAPEHERVTLLGDAIHPMAPFKGQVCNYLCICSCIELLSIQS